MSVPNQIPYNIYTANGLSTVFTYEFYLISSGDLQVSINGDVVTTGYTVAGVGNVSGGDITFLTPPANGATVMLERVVPTYRLTDYQDNGDLLADTVNKDFDRLWMAIQRSFIDLGLALRRPLFGGPYNAEGYRIRNLADPVGAQDAVTRNYVDNVSLNRTLRIPENYIARLPSRVGRANKMLAFDAAGEPILVIPPSGSASDVLIELAKPSGSSLIGGLGVYITKFGVTGDGITDDFASLKSAVEYGNSIQQPVICPPGMTVKILGDEDIDFGNGFDFNGSTIDISEYSGHLKLGDGQVDTEYGIDSDLISDIRSKSTALAGYVWNDWASYSQLNNCSIYMTVDQPWWQYRGNDESRDEMNVYIRDGIVEAPLLFSIDPKKITGLTARPMPEQDIEYKNVVIDLGENQSVNDPDTSWRPFHITGNRIVLRDWNFNQPDITYTKNHPVIIYPYRCTRLRMENINTMWPNQFSTGGSDWEYTYVFNMEKCFDIVVKNFRSYGHGWGAMATHDVQRITFDKCMASRIDAHKPFREWMRIHDCDVSQWGVNIQGIGDLEIRGGTMTIGEMPNNATQARFINSRGDAGGICWGNLTVDGTEFRSWYNNNEFPLFQIQIPNNHTHPAGSPIPHTLWKTVSYRNLRTRDNLTLDLMPASDAGLPVIRYVRDISVTDCTGGRFSFKNMNLSTWTPYNDLPSTNVNAASNTANMNLSIKNVRVPNTFTLRDGGSNVSKWCFNINAENMHGDENFHPNFELTVGGTVTLTGCHIEGFDFFNDFRLAKYLSIRMIGGSIRNTKRYNSYPISPSFNNSPMTTYLDLSISNTFIQVVDNESLTSLLQAKLRDNVYAIAGGPRLDELQVTPDTQASTALSFTELNTGNVMCLRLGNVGAGDSMYIPFMMPEKGNRSYVRYSDDQSAIISRSATGNTLSISVTGGASLRYICIK